MLKELKYVLLLPVFISCFTIFVLVTSCIIVVLGPDLGITFLWATAFTVSGIFAPRGFRLLYATFWFARPFAWAIDK